MKKVKRNAVILAVLLFVCVAVYLNFAYNKGEADAALEQQQQESGAAAGDVDDAGLYYTEDGSYVAEYFADVRLNRQEARASAATALSTITETEGASQEAIDTAMGEIAELTELTLKESELESLIIAKGFDDCVVYISDTGVNVTVPSPAEGLSTASVARITDIVTSETDCPVNKLKVIEINEE